MITAALILTQVSLVLTSIGSGSPKMEPTCWGPGIWPHPRHCRLFTLCLLDPSRVHNMITGHLFLCPLGTGFSAGRNACVPSKLVTNCHHNTKHTDSAVEASPAEHLLSAPKTNQFHCAGHSVPYCDGSDVLVVCAPNQGLLGVVNCSEKAPSSHGSYQCDKTAGKCVPVEDFHARVPVHLHSGPNLKTVTEHAEPGRGRSLAVSRGSFPEKEEHKPVERGSSHSVGEPISCERPGKQCSQINKTQLIHCSDDLQVIARWDCYSFFPLVLYQNGIEVLCDSEKDTCVVQIGNTSHDMNKTTRVPDVARNVCKSPGRQCVPGNATIIAECSADLEVQHVWNCASLFPSQTVLATSNASFECDSHSNSCVMSFGIASGELHTTTTTSPQTDCKRPGIQCSTKNGSLLLQCSDNLEVLNTWPCSYLFPLEAFQDRRAVDTLCDPQRDSCVLYLNEQLLDQGQKPVLVNEHQCTGPGMQCSANNSSVLLECSETLNVLHAWDCTSLVPSEMLQDDVLKITCDQHHSSCILYIESENSQKDAPAEVKCRKPGKHCINLSVLVECSDSLEVLNEWNCASLLGDSTAARCSLDLDRCVLSYPDTSTSSVIPTEAPLFISQSCQKEGLQCANNHTIMDCPYDLSEPNFMMSCADMIQMSHNDKALGYCDMETSSCVLKANQETLHLKLSIFDMTEHTVFPDFMSKCAKGGLHCADNMTLVMCSGLPDNLDYAIMCGQRLSSSGTSIRSFCDPQTESCVIDTQTDTTPDDRTMLTTVAPTSLASSTSSSWQKLLISQLKDELPIKQTDEGEMCTRPGWRCLNQDILILCSDQLSLRGYLPCSEAYGGYEGRGFCDNTASKCALDNSVN
ncbi:uncharacterized protein [Anabrus simplex]|uniref:uncharacterized protein n=1 Tax=Anabrus simplex TaxID=316456 RepID=UPI0035A28A1B